MRPRLGKFNLKAEEMDCLDWVILSGCPREEAFLKFVRPDYIGSKSSVAVRDAVKQFFSMGDVKAYMEAYKDTISSLSRPQPRISAEDYEKRKASSKTKLVEFAMTLIDNIENVDDPEFVLKIADKCQLLDGDLAVEQPRRYLPVTCSDCNYRKFVEENCEIVEDETSQNDI